MKRMVTLCLVAASLACASGSATARDGWNAAGAVLGAAGGLALGAAIANSAPRPVYVAPPPPAAVYVPPPRPVYVESIDDEPVCVIKRRRYVDEFGDVVIRRVKVCD